MLCKQNSGRSSPVSETSKFGLHIGFRRDSQLDINTSWKRRGKAKCDMRDWEREETYDLEGLIASTRESKPWRPVGVAADTTVEELCVRQNGTDRSEAGNVPLWLRLQVLTLSHVHRSSPRWPEAQDSEERGRQRGGEWRMWVGEGWLLCEEGLMWEVAKEKSLCRERSRVGRARPWTWAWTTTSSPP